MTGRPGAAPAARLLASNGGAGDAADCLGDEAAAATFGQMSSQGFVEMKEGVLKLLE